MKRSMVLAVVVISTLAMLIAALLATKALKQTVTIGTYLVVGLTLYMAKDNIVLMLRHRLPRRGWYALAYFSIGGLLWSVVSFVIAPAPAILLDWKSGVYTAFMIGAIIGIAGIAYDYHMSWKAERDPRLPPEKDETTRSRG